MSFADVLVKLINDYADQGSFNIAEAVANSAQQEPVNDPVQQPTQQIEQQKTDQVDSNQKIPETKNTVDRRIVNNPKYQELQSGISDTGGTVDDFQNQYENSTMSAVDITSGDNLFSGSGGGNFDDNTKLDPRITDDSRYVDMQNGVTDTGGYVGGLEEHKPDDKSMDLFSSARDTLRDLSDPHFMDRIFMGDGFANPGNLPILKSTDREKFEAQERSNYRNDNPMPEGALVYRLSDGSEVPVTNENNQGVSVPLTTDAWKQKYYDYWDSLGGVEEGYKTATKDVSDVLSNVADYNNAINAGDFDAASRALTANGYNLGSAIDKLANENYDDGNNLRWDSLKSSKMSGKEYKKLNDIFGGRPDWMIDDGASYDKLTEMREFNFIPYIEDQKQADIWGAQSVAEDVSKLYSLFGDTRKREYQPYINYNGQNIALEELNEKSNQMLNRYGDEARQPHFTVTNPQTGEKESFFDSYFSNKDAKLTEGQDEDGMIYVEFPGSGKRYDFGIPENDDDIKRIVNNINEWAKTQVQVSDDLVQGVDYTQSNGEHISLSPEDLIALADQKDRNEGIDYGGPLNLAKDSADRKDFAQMVSTLDFSDIAPATVDLLFGSAPLFFPQTAWPMAVSNALVATEGLDPQIYNPNDLSYGRLSNDMTGEKYFTNVALNAATPALEHIAGVAGGGSGVLGKPIQNVLAKNGAPPSLRYLLDMLGEGFEEVIAGLWEDSQSQGWRNWYADPIYEKNDDGSIKTTKDPVTGEDIPVIATDSVGHELRDSNTPLPKRLMNMVGPSVENALAGSWLGFLLGAPKMGMNKITNSGYYSPDESSNIFESMNRKTMRDAEDLIEITPEDYGTFNKRREEM